MSGRLRSISSMAKAGSISNEEKGRLKDLVVIGDKHVRIVRKLSLVFLTGSRSRTR